jgi:hypothetical protein
MGKRDVSLERQWRGRMRKYEKSGLTIRQFCEREDLVVHQFSWWRRELKRRDANIPRSKKSQRVSRRKRQIAGAVASFVPVHVATGQAATIEIVLDQPLRIAVAPGFDAQMLTDVVRALEQRTC